MTVCSLAPLHQRLLHGQGVMACLVTRCATRPSGPARLSNEDHWKVACDAGATKKGLARMAEVDQSQLERIIAGLADIGPDFARYVMTFAFGDI